MVNVLEKELMDEPTPLEQAVGAIIPKLKEGLEVLGGIGQLGKNIRDTQGLAGNVRDAFGTLSLALNYDRILQAYNGIRNFIGNKYQITVEGAKEVTITKRALEDYKNAINWIRRKLNGFRYAHKNELIELGTYAIDLPEKKLGYA